MYPFEYLTQKNIIESCTVEITDQCDFKCLHCDYPKKLNGKFMSLPSAKTISDQLRKMNTFRITISGGEPFEHPEAIEIINLFHENSFLVKIITNGFKLNQDQLEALRNLPRVEVVFSIYGTLSVHEKITGVKGSFEKIIKNISFLKSGKCKVKTQTSVFTENFDNLEELSKLSAQIGVDISYDPYISNTLKNDKVAKLRLSNEDLIVYYKKFTNIFELVNKVLNDKEIIKLASTDCGLAISSVTIDSYGNIFPCGNVRIAGGNISETDLSEIWTNSSLFSEFRSRINSPRKECSNCDMKTLCNQCIAMSIADQGDWKLPPLEYCRHMNCLRKGAASFHIAKIT